MTTREKLRKKKQPFREELTALGRHLADRAAAAEEGRLISVEVTREPQENRTIRIKVKREPPVTKTVRVMVERA